MGRRWRNCNHNFVDATSAQQFVERGEAAHCRPSTTASNDARLTFVIDADQTSARPLPVESSGELFSDFTCTDYSDRFGQSTAPSETLRGVSCKQPKPTQRYRACSAPSCQPQAREIVRDFNNKQKRSKQQYALRNAFDRRFQY